MKTIINNFREKGRGKKLKIIGTICLVILLLAIFSWIAVFLLSTLNGETPPDWVAKYQPTFLFILLVLVVAYYIDLVNDLLKSVGTQPESTGKRAKMQWALTIWWQAWKLGAATKFIQLMYLGVGGIVLAIYLFVHPLQLSIKFLVGPIAVLIMIAMITQPLIAGQRILSEMKEEK